MFQEIFNLRGVGLTISLMNNLPRTNLVSSIWWKFPENNEIEITCLIYRAGVLCKILAFSN